MNRWEEYDRVCFLLLLVGLAWGVGLACGIFSSREPAGADNTTVTGTN